MKSNLLVALFLFAIQFAAVAQDTEPADSTKQEEETYTIGSPSDDVGDVHAKVEFKLREVDTSKNVVSRWFTLGLGVNPVAHDKSFDLPTGNGYQDWDLRIGKSTNVDLGIVQTKINLVDHKLNLYSGLSFLSTKYMFEDDFQINPDSDSWEVDYSQLQNISTKKNRLTSSHLYVPLMLNFESSLKHYQSIRVSAGGFAGFRLSSNQKIKFKSKGDNPFEDKIKYKERDDFNQQNFIYGWAAELGYGPVNFYGKIHMNPLFEKGNNNPDLNTYSIGIMVLPF